MKTQWLVLVLLLIPCVCHSATVNPLISADKTVVDWIGVDKTISDTVLLGRAIITEDRKRNAAFYSGVTKTHDALVADHQLEIARMRKQLAVIGFKDESDFIRQSNAYDKNKGLTEKEYWR